MKLIVSVDKNYLIGKSDGLPWKFKGELPYFKKLTSGNIIIFGRKTFESIGRVLPNRTTIVVTSKDDYEAPEGVLLSSSLDNAIILAEDMLENDQTIWIAGGGSIYKQALDLDIIDEIYITRIPEEYEGDVYFPEIDWQQWELTDVKHKENSEGTILNFEVYRKID